MTASLNASVLHEMFGVCCSHTQHVYDILYISSYLPLSPLFAQYYAHQDDLKRIISFYV
uniref:Uncharacterized protein n=1 Tax=Arion vulgaris TaxID=1028688 RepID=A0A0B7B6S6_9EUPU